MIIIIIVVLYINKVDSSLNYVNISQLHTVNYDIYPFAWCLYDDFLYNDVLNSLVYDINSIIDDDDNRITSDGEYNSYMFNTFKSQNLVNLFTELTSNDFIKMIEKITGVSNLTASKFKGINGIRRVKSNGYIKLHPEYNNVHITDDDDNNDNVKLERRASLTIYMNPNWKDEYNGDLWLCNEPHRLCVNNIHPLLNRAVLFITTNITVQGYPIPLNVPDNIYSHSIHINYYSKNNNDDDNDNIQNETTSTVWYDEKNYSTIMFTSNPYFSIVDYKDSPIAVPLKDPPIVSFPLKININNKETKTIDFVIYQSEEVLDVVNKVCNEHRITIPDCNRLLDYCHSIVKT